MYLLAVLPHHRMCGSASGGSEGTLKTAMGVPGV